MLVVELSTEGKIASWDHLRSTSEFDDLQNKLLLNKHGIDKVALEYFRKSRYTVGVRYRRRMY